MPHPLLTIALLLLSTIAHGSPDSFRVHTDYPYLKNEKILLPVLYKTDTAFNANLSIEFYKYNSEKDSTLTLGYIMPLYSFKKGIHKLKIDFSKQDTNLFAEHKFSEILKRTGSIAPGFYKTYIKAQNDNNKYEIIYLHHIDSLLELNSPVRKDINKNLKKKNGLIKVKTPMAASSKSNGAGHAFARSQRKINRAVKKRGLTSQQHERGGKSYVDLFYEDCFAGRYEVKNKGTLSAQIDQMENAAANKDVHSSISTELGDPSLFSQYQKFNAKSEKEELRGAVSLTTNMANGQEPNSGISNNYYEVKGTSELPVCNIPIEVEGLYTSQDKNREVKSSYVRVHYNPQKLKDNLLKSISSYNSKFASQTSKSAAIAKIYGGAIANLEGEKKKLETDLNATVELDEKNNKDPDVSRKRIADIDKKIDRYKTLLSQYENTKYFDSSAVFAKTKNITNTDNLSYKQLSKLGADLLPDGKSKKFLSGITSMDAGMFPKNESKYTMAGQMMKGGSLSYDLGFCETSVTAGKTEFIGRTGSIDRYTTYSSKTTFQTIKDHKLGFIYYGYTADRKLYSRDVFFDKINISAPGFFNTVHILSVDYAGSISKYLTFESEAASSYHKLNNEAFSHMPDKEKMAYHFTADANVPKTYLNMRLEYDKTGKNFENNTLPMSLVGTKQYKATAGNEFFHSRLSVGIQFNKLVQNNFSSTSSNVKWGFDIKTGFKKYPNIGISYKPYTTFQSHTDTFAIRQRPMFGSVWVAKATYQFKDKGTSWRFMTLYNQCQTIADTTKYGNTTAQANVIYTAKKITSTLGVGYLNVLGTSATLTQNTLGPTNFVNFNAVYNINATLNLTGGGEVGLAPFGLCKRAVNAGLSIRPQKLPFTFRIIARSNTFTLTEHAAWQSVYSGCIDITYKFKTSLK